MPFETLITDRSGGIARVTIHRPEKLNSLNAKVIGELEECFRDFAGDAEVRVVILTGAGEKS
ncbi:MAG: enoyl-CoA hydratase/isomerase family protein, partial [bacterium]